jgi:hypothetical protein
MLHIGSDDPAYAMLHQGSGLLADAFEQAGGCRGVVATQDLRDELLAERDRQLLGSTPDGDLLTRLRDELDADELAIVVVNREGTGYQVSGTLWDLSANRARMRTIAHAASPSEMPQVLQELASKLVAAEACHGWSGSLTVRRDVRSTTTDAVADGRGTIHEEVTYTVQPGGKAHYQARVSLDNTTIFKNTQPGQPRSQTVQASGEGSGDAFVDVQMGDDGQYGVSADQVEIQVTVTDSAGLSGTVPYPISGASASGQAAPSAPEISGTWSRGGSSDPSHNGDVDAEQDNVTWHLTRS